MGNLLLRLLLLSNLPSPTSSQTTTATITATPGTNTFIIAEDSTSEVTLQNEGLFTVTADVPVTISRYNDDWFVDGQQPFYSNDAKVIVTSDCSTSEISVTPTIVWAEEGSVSSVTVTLDTSGSSEVDGSSMSFLEPASYQASWNWSSYFCNSFPTPSPLAFEKSNDLSESPTDFPLLTITGNGAPTKSPMAVTGSPVTNEPTGPTSPAVTKGGEPQFTENSTDQGQARSGGFRGRSISFRWSATFLAMLVVSFLFMGRDGGIVNNQLLIHFGKFAVVALSVSSLLPNKSSLHKKTKNSNNINENSNKTPMDSRSLQSTCTYNVQLVIEGCTHPVQVNAPLARVIDAKVENVKSTPGQGEDKCNFAYTADIGFPLTLDGSDNFSELEMRSGVGSAEPLGYTECARPVEGRPFVDSSGSSLLALPLIGGNVVEGSDGCENGSALRYEEVVRDSCRAHLSESNATASDHARALLGEEWIQRALGEHASIASFSAFSIALMTNHAPSNLVEDALKAGLDEVRHAEASFRIASKLTGKDVSPGALPESNHEFLHNLEGLAMSVAREGCIDETLSALAAALEADDINTNGKYANVDTAISSLIRNELEIIAKDESRHSALAWRTLFWVCSVDDSACDIVKREVLEENNLKARLLKRFAGTLDSKSLDMIEEEWRKVYDTLRHLQIDSGVFQMHGLICKENNNGSLLSATADGILRGVFCDVSMNQGI